MCENTQHHGDGNIKQKTSGCGFLNHMYKTLKDVVEKDNIPDECPVKMNMDDIKAVVAYAGKARKASIEENLSA